MLLPLGVLVTFVRLAGSQGAWMVSLARGLFAAGVVAFVVGVVGIVAGGRASAGSPVS